MEQYVANVTILYLVKTPEIPPEVLPLFGQRPKNGLAPPPPPPPTLPPLKKTLQ